MDSSSVIRIGGEARDSTGRFMEVEERAGNSGGRGLSLAAGGERGIEVGEGVALDLAVGFFSGAELGDRAHFA